MPKATVTLKSKQRAGIKRPVLHVLMPDGRVTEFKDHAIVIPATGDGDDGIFALMINGKGEVFHTPDGEPVILDVPPVGLDLMPDPDRLISWKEVARLVGKSVRHTRRMVDDGQLPRPVKTRPEGRAVMFNQGEIRAAVALLMASKA